jgi:hypothetical protein
VAGRGATSRTPPEPGWSWRLPSEAAKAVNAEVEAWRAAGAPKRRRAAQAKPVRTAAHLWDVYAASPVYARKAASTQADYKRKAAVFLAAFGDGPVAAIEKMHLYRWWEEL